MAVTSDYTPSWIEVLCRYQEWGGGSSSDLIREAEFDRFLRDIKAKAWEEGARSAYDARNPYREIEGVVT